MDAILEVFSDTRWLGIMYGVLCLAIAIVMGIWGWNKYVKVICTGLSVLLSGMAFVFAMVTFSTHMADMWENKVLLHSFLISIACGVVALICMYLCVNSKPGEMRISRALMRKRPVKLAGVPKKPGGFSIYDTGRDILYYGVASDMHKAVQGHLDGRGDQQLYQGVQNGHPMEIRYYTLRRSGRGTISYLYRDLVACMRQLRGTVDLNASR